MSKKGNKKVGAPSKFSDKKLEEILIEFMKQNPITKLNPSQLEKQTGVGRQIWRRKMGEKIEKLKNTVQADFGGRGGKEYIPIPNPSEIVDTHWNNKKEMIASFQMYEETIQKFYEDAKAYHEKKEEVVKLKKKISELQEELRIAYSDVEFYKQQLKEVSILSKSPTQREQHKLKNVLDLKEKSNEKKALSTDFVNNFPELFSD
ncbi:hypothetical protein [Bacillus marasmi]|uniref:hypothetical protein n=1 Tax=Bacillus marasmi TaxID=1926279 RepID=UPI0011C7AAA0|nr:hypothetical protein [Bacillus marasmi]